MRDRSANRSAARPSGSTPLRMRSALYSAQPSRCRRFDAVADLIVIRLELRARRIRENLGQRTCDRERAGTAGRARDDQLRGDGIGAFVTADGSPGRSAGQKSIGAKPFLSSVGWWQRLTGRPARPAAPR